MAARVAGFVLRAADRDATARFYEDLGLQVHEHAQGGPLHHGVGPMSEECVLEIYQQSISFPRDAVMIYVDSLDEALRVAARHCIAAETEIKSTAGERFVYVNDPDGRAALLIEHMGT